MRDNNSVDQGKPLADTNAAFGGMGISGEVAKESERTNRNPPLADEVTANAAPSKSLYDMMGVNKVDLGRNGSGSQSRTDSPARPLTPCWADSFTSLAELPVAACMEPQTAAQGFTAQMAPRMGDSGQLLCRSGTVTPFTGRGEGGGVVG